MMQADDDSLALLKFGLKVCNEQKNEIVKTIKSNPVYKEEFQKVKSHLFTMKNEDEFLEVISNSHKEISAIPDNWKIIQLREQTFQIRAINPEKIESLTERAFFNSFNLDRIVLNDLEEENNFRESQKSVLEMKENFKNNPRQNVDDSKVVRLEKDDDDIICICGRTNSNLPMIQCANQRKCRGSNWYHMECVGVAQNDPVIQGDYLCQKCRKEDEDLSCAQGSNKKVKRNELKATPAPQTPPAPAVSEIVQSQQTPQDTLTSQLEQKREST